MTYTTRKKKPFHSTWSSSTRLQRVCLPNKHSTCFRALVLVNLCLCVMSQNFSVLLQNKNVLYITLEMAEERIAERIDANLLNVPIGDIADLPKQMFESKVTNLSEDTRNTDYQRVSDVLHYAGHFRSLLQELHLRSHLDLILFSLITLIYKASSRYRRKQCQLIYNC